MKRRIKFLKTADGAILGLQLDISATSLFFIDPNADYAIIEERPTANGLNVEITAEEDTR